MDKVKCHECGWVGTKEEVLTAPNPFDTTETLWGCPKCKAVDSIGTACQHLGCREFATIGTPLPDGGYALTCYKHCPERFEVIP